MKRFEGRRWPRARTDGARDEGPGGGATAPATVTGRYRRPPGGWLLAAAVLVPLVLALVGLFLDGAPGSRSGAESAGQAASSAPASEPVGDPISVTTSGGRRSVTATLPDEASKKALVEGVRASSEGLRVDSEVTVDPQADAPPVAGIATVLAAGRGITDFGVVVDRATMTLTGQADEQSAGTQAVFAAGQSYPGVRLVDRLRFPGAQAAASGPLPPECEQVRADVAQQLKSTPVEFTFGGATVGAQSAERLTAIGRRLASCPFTRIEVAGHTDDKGSAAANTTVSQRRADAVREILVQAGVPGQIVTAKGYGSSRPVADNATAEGQAANRRVEIRAA